MKSEPFTIRIFVPYGDPEGVRVIDKMNWTGLGVVFPRTRWETARSRSEFDRAGVYILVGNTDDDLPTVYVGQGDLVRDRIQSHYKNKDFWDWGITFVSSGARLNRAHVTWIEHELVKRATLAKSCTLDNGNAPSEPNLSEQEKADTRAFLHEILQILPLVGLRAFEKPVAVASPNANSKPPASTDFTELDTIVVPAKRQGFRDVFLGENSWYAIRIAGGKLASIKYIAAYQGQPTSAITHYAPVARIEPYGDKGKYKLIFSEPATEIPPIPFGDAPGGYMQGMRYTSLSKLLTAKKVTDIA
tara:strand:- start:657 stop:1562 length:906 start_codon:yes stop_codon:yes gene_type:complete